MTLAQVRAALEPGDELVPPANLAIRNQSAQSYPAEAESGGPALLVLHDLYTIRDASGAKVLEFLLSDPARPEAPGSRIVMISVTGARFSTAGGVNPGTSLAEAAQLLGPATLLDDDAEGFGREWVVFRNGPSGIRFVATGPGGDGRTAGIYAPSASSSPSFKPGSEIRALVIGRH